jgi:hypothetical protein
LHLVVFRRVFVADFGYGWSGCGESGGPLANLAGYKYRE